MTRTSQSEERKPYRKPEVSNSEKISGFGASGESFTESQTEGAVEEGVIGYSGGMAETVY